jgi:hypothetical protein
VCQLVLALQREEQHALVSESPKIAGVFARAARTTRRGGIT